MHCMQTCQQVKDQSAEPLASTRNIVFPESASLVNSSELPSDVKSCSATVCWPAIWIM